jgi:HK97 family phage major capsid protein
MDYDIKADVLEASFDAVRAQALEAELAQLRSEVEGLRARLQPVRRPALEGAKADGTDGAQRRAFVDGYLRKGLEAGVEAKAFTISNPAEGGFAVPREIDAMIQATLRDISPIRRVAQVVNVGSAQYRKLVSLNNVASGWVSETAARPETASIQFAEVVPPMGELYANPSASQAMLDDAMFDLEAWLAEEVAREFARAEGAAFVSGSGTNQPRGFLTGTPTTQPDGTRPFGTLQYLPTGVAGDFPATNPQDRILDLIHLLRPAYRQNAVFVGSSATFARIRKMKDSTGAFIWQSAMSKGQPDLLFGYPVVEAEDMPAIAPNSFALAFGDFGAGYIIAERAETRILRDPFSNKPYVHFYATKRVSGSVLNSEAIKLLRFATS